MFTYKPIPNNAKSTILEKIILLFKKNFLYLLDDFIYIYIYIYIYKIILLF